jgi:hypothetical protein
VDAPAEGQVTVGVAVPAQLPGAGDLRVVQVGGADDGHDVLAAADRAAADIDVPGCDPGDGHDRRLPPEQLLDHRRDRLGLGDQAPAGVRVPGEVAEEAVE